MSSTCGRVKWNTNSDVAFTKLIITLFIVSYTCDFKVCFRENVN